MVRVGLSLATIALHEIPAAFAIVVLLTLVLVAVIVALAPKTKS